MVMAGETYPGDTRAGSVPLRTPPRPDERASFILRIAARVPGPAGEHLAQLFQGQPEPLLAELDATVALVSFDAGEIVVADDTEANVLGYVLSGMLAMEKSLQDGRRHIIGLLAPCDMYGRVFEGPTSFAIRALNAVQVLQFDRKSFEEILFKNPSLERRFLVDLLDELDAAREWLLLSGSGRSSSGWRPFC
jgi:CRP/FNR family transcriptional regulator, anaerobic regulatory protein